MGESRAPSYGATVSVNDAPAEGTADAAVELPPPIPAATVIVLRDGPNGVETLMLRRNARGPFGGMWVFPGGRVDPVDADPELPDDELAAARRAAAREAAEEAGLVIDPHKLVTFSHWTPPPIQPKRFATWFFVAECPPGAVEVDGAEIHDHVWLSTDEVLRRRDAGEIELAPPTWVTLWHLRGHRTVEEALAAAADAVPERFATRRAKTSDPAVMLWHGDAGYETGDSLLEGGRHRLVMADGAWSYERSAASPPPDLAG